MPSADVLAVTGDVQLNRWNVAAPVGTSVVVTYSFPSAAASYDVTPRPGFAAFSATQQTYVRQALATWGAASGIAFVEVPESAGGQIRFAMYDETGQVNSVGQQLSGFGYFPFYTYNGVTYSTNFNNLGGDIFLNSVFYAGNDGSLAPGQRGYSILIHEIGHALGLKHPFEGSPVIDPAHDNSTYTVLSYNRPNTTTELGTVDFEATQYYYGTQDLSYSFDLATLTMSLTGTGAGEWVLGTEFNDVIYGLSGDDTLVGYIGNDTLDGGAGADTMRGGAGNDTYYADNASDSFIEIFNEGTDVVLATAPLVTLGVNVENLTNIGASSFAGIGNSSANVMTGGTSYDNLYGGGGNDTLYGGALEDILVGDAGDDLLYGGDGGDVLSELYDVVNSGNDTFDGGNGIDIMYSGAGNDIVYGGTDAANNYGNLGDGNDIYHGSAGTDVVEAGNGNDTINGNNGDDSLYGNAGDDVIHGGAGIDLLSGSTGNDYLDGGANNDLLVGDEGADTLLGGTGLDVLYGFAGDDILNGGAGGDVDGIYGGSGNDSFQVGGAGFGIDYIWDFVGGVGLSDRLLVATGVAITSQSTSSGNYYINFNNGSQAVIVGRTSVLAEDIVLSGF